MPVSVKKEREGECEDQGGHTQSHQVFVNRQQWRGRGEEEDRKRKKDISLVNNLTFKF